MTILIDGDQVISSPALVPAERDLARDGGGELTIGLVNNMPDPALKATERQFLKLLQAAAGPRRIRLHCFSLPSVKRSPEAKWHVESEYSDLSDLKRQKFDGLIVTGAEPVAPELDQSRTGATSPTSSTGPRPTRARRSGRVLPRMRRCCTSTASHGGGCRPNVMASSIATP